MTDQHFLSIPVRLGLVLALLAALANMAAPVPVAYAATTRSIKVGNVDDNNPGGGCTLREAIDLANAGAGPTTYLNGCTVTEKGGFPPIPVTYSISLPSYTYTLSGAAGDDSNSSGDLDISANVTISGMGAGSTIISGGGIDRVFHIDPAGVGHFTVNISGVAIQKGNAGLSYGGGIYNNSGTVTIADSTLSSNQADNDGGGIYNDDGGAVTLTDSTLSGNQTNGSGGGIYNDGGTVTLTDSTLSGNRTTGSGWGGGIYNRDSGTLTLTNSTFSDNEADDGGGIWNEGTLNITNSTFSGNQANSSGGGIYNGGGTVTLTDSTLSGNQAVYNGGGIDNNDGTLTLTDSTLSGNQADDGGGIYNQGPLILTNGTLSGNQANSSGGGIYNGGSTADLTNVTITGNTADNDSDDAGDGGGIRRISGTVNLKNTIVAGNSDMGAEAHDCDGAISAQGDNLVGQNGDANGCPTGAGVTVVSGGISTVLDALADNGGSTQTHALVTDGPAIDAVTDCTDLSSSPVTTDQRGVARPADGDGDGTATCDIGAFEFQPSAIYLPLILRGA
jgi:hypothetical protein